MTVSDVIAVQVHRQTDSVYRTVEREDLSRNEHVILHVLQ